MAQAKSAEKNKESGDSGPETTSGPANNVTDKTSESPDNAGSAPAKRAAATQTPSRATESTR